MVERGELGTKAGKGFYEWTPESILALKGRIARTLSDVAQVGRTIKRRQCLNCPDSIDIHI